MDKIDDIQICIQAPNVPPSRRKLSQKPGQKALISEGIHVKRLIGWVEKYFVLWNDLKLIYYSTNSQRKHQASLAMYSRGKYSWTPKRKREGTVDLQEYNIFLPNQSEKDSFPRIHLHHKTEPKRNVYLSFKSESMRESWLSHFRSLKKLHDPPFSEDLSLPSDSERGRSLFSSMILDNNLDTDFISIQHFKDVIRQLPIVYQFSTLIPAFATKLDGISFQRLYNEILGFPTLLVVDTSMGVFIIFMPKCQQRFFGPNIDFRFGLVSDNEVEVTSPNAGDILTMNCDKDIIAISCGPNKRVYIGQEMKYVEFDFGLSKDVPNTLCRSLMAFTFSDCEQTEVCA